MDGRLRDGVVHVGADARQRFHEARGYGRPTDDGTLQLDPVEAAHLLARGDLTTVDGQGFEEFLAHRNPDFLPRFLVYVDLRGRGFYLSPAREGWVEADDGADLVVYPRGDGPWDDTVAHRVTIVDERDPITMESLSGGVLAVVDEESTVTYFETKTSGPAGSGTPTPEPARGRLLGDRVLVWAPPESLHVDAFYGQPLDVEGPDVLQLSLVEAAYLAAEGQLSLSGETAIEAVVEQGRTVEGERFDRRLQTYRALRDRGLVPKTGFKFGADFRVYPDFHAPDDVGHSETLVRVVPPGEPRLPRELALDVRLAHGVRKSMTFALPTETDLTWRTVSRLTP
jgi:tRNA-intron endonuclease